METQHVYCLGCGGDLTSMPRERRNLGAESKAAAKPRERVLTSWTALLRGEVISQSLSIKNATKDVANLGKMCHKCFSEIDKYQKLKDRLYVPMTKMNEPAVITSTSVSVATSTRKRMAEGGESNLGYNCFVN